MCNRASSDEVTGNRKSLAHLRVTLQRVTTSHGQLQARATSDSPSPSPLLTGGYDYLTPQARLVPVSLFLSFSLSMLVFRASANSTVHHHQMDDVVARRCTII